METTPSSSGAKPVSHRRARGWIIPGVLSIGVALMLGPGADVLRDYAGPKSVKLAWFVVGWLGVGLWLWYGKRLRRQDELDILMNRQALAFAFYAALVVVAGLHQLQYIGLIPVVTLRTEHLFFALIGLMAIGQLLSKIRYR
jgi:hypothetical protein